MIMLIQISDIRRSVLWGSVLVSEFLHSNEGWPTAGTREHYVMNLYTANYYVSPFHSHAVCPAVFVKSIILAQ